MTQRVRVYIACSLDGFIAGPAGDLSWLPGADGGAVDASAQDPAALSYEAFMSDVGALLMGRRTHDAVVKLAGEWPYGDLPVLVATHRPLSPTSPTVRAVNGDIRTVVALAKEAAAGKDVYLDGGELIRQALDEELVDDIVMTVVPIVLGTGHPLFAGVQQRHRFRLLGHHTFAGGLLQLHFHPVQPRR